MTLAPQPQPAISIPEDTSDYGSDIDEATADSLLSQLDASPLNTSHLALESIEEAPPRDDETWDLRVSAHLSRLRSSLDRAQASSEELFRIIQARQPRQASVEVEYDEGNRRSFSPAVNDTPDKNNENDKIQTSSTKTAPNEPQEPDTRSPLQRFRTRPKKPLSVTDLVSPAWCEQQYEYSLSKYGRVRRTPAMKQGSSVHRELEEQVHVRVPVQVATSEDRFGLRLWNSIHAIRTLRETGLTREVELWGVVQGEVVIGVVDEITNECPVEEEAEERIRREVEGLERGRVNGRTSTKKKGGAETLESDQRTLEQFLTGKAGAKSLESDSAELWTQAAEERKPGSAPRSYYVVDVKTRQSRTLPAAGSPSRPTHMQLMLYHHLLSNLGTGKVPAERIFERYNLDPNANFSDQFIAELANLDIQGSMEGGSQADSNDDEEPPGSSQPTSDPLTELLSHNTLTSLWDLLVRECALTFPAPSSPSDEPIISPVLTAEFRTASSYSSKTSNGHDTLPAGSLLGRRSFAFDGPRLEAYLAEEMRWWKGERPTRGVEVEEAYKCRICEFAEGCTWRAEKIEEGVRKARLRKEGRSKSEV